MTTECSYKEIAIMHRERTQPSAARESAHGMHWRYLVTAARPVGLGGAVGRVEIVILATAVEVAVPAVVAVAIAVAPHVPDDVRRELELLPVDLPAGTGQS